MATRKLCAFYLSAFNRFSTNDEFIFTKTADKYIGITRKFLTTKIESLISYYQAAGLGKGDKIAIISENRIEWIVTDIAAAFLGLVTVPIYNTLSKEQIKYILGNSGSVMCFVS